MSNAYFVGVVANGADWAMLAWTVTLGVSNTAVMIAMPVIGACADLHARKRWLLRISTIGCVLATAALALAGRDDVLMANLAGLAMGSSQSAGRAMTGVFAPATRLAEFYGLWTLSVQVAAIVGPLTYGAVVYLTGNNHRLGMMFTGGFFVIGLLLIASIDMERGRRAAASTA